jgi:hypothetical protein
VLIPSLKAAFDTTDIPVRISCTAMATIEAVLLVAFMTIKLGKQAYVCVTETETERKMGLIHNGLTNVLNCIWNVHEHCHPSLLHQSAEAYRQGK